MFTRLKSAYNADPGDHFEVTVWVLVTNIRPRVQLGVTLLSVTILTIKDYWRLSNVSHIITNFFLLLTQPNSDLHSCAKGNGVQNCQKKKKPAKKLGRVHIHIVQGKWKPPRTQRRIASVTYGISRSQAVTCGDLVRWNQRKCNSSSCHHTFNSTISLSCGLFCGDAQRTWLERAILPSMRGF